MDPLPHEGMMPHLKTKISRKLHPRWCGTTRPTSVSNLGKQSPMLVSKDGPRIGQRGWVGNRWHDPLDRHIVLPRESRSREVFDLDYEPNSRQVMNAR